MTTLQLAGKTARGWWRRLKVSVTTAIAIICDVVDRDLLLLIVYGVHGGRVERVGGREIRKRVNSEQGGRREEERGHTTRRDSVWLCDFM